MMASPTSRSLDLLRSEGWMVDVVERWIPKAEIRRDLFGFGDLLAVHPLDRVHLIVQATSASNVSARLKKAQALGSLSIWLRSGGQFEVWGWGNDGKQWTVRRVAVQAEDLKASELTPARRRRTRKKIKPNLFDNF